MVAPLVIAGGIAAAGALATAYGASKSGGTTRTYLPNVDNYRYGGSDEGRAAWRARLDQREQAALGARDARLAQEQASRAEQQRLLGEYDLVSQGKGPSIARMQLAEAQQTEAQRAAALAASVRGGGGNQLLAQQMAQEQAALGAARASAEQAKVRQSEIENARAARGELASGMRGADMAGLTLQEQAAQNALGARMDMEDKQFAATQAYDAAQRGELGRANDLENAKAQAEKGRWMQLGGGLMGVGGQVGVAALGAKK